jgi:hypothetical protein
MKTIRNLIQVSAIVLGAGASMNAVADLTVVIGTPSPAEIVNLNVGNTGSGVTPFSGAVYSGIYNETINGAPTSGFCIDVAHDVSVNEIFTDYSYASLVDAPDTPAGPMGADHAVIIEKLWAAYYTQAQSSPLMAAALQLAIWESESLSGTPGTITLNGESVALGGVNFGNNLEYTISATDYGSDTGVIAEADTMLGSLPSLTAEADLMAIVSTNGQSYVIAVPEPTTLMAGGLLLLPFGASALRIVRRRKNA